MNLRALTRSERGRKRAAALVGACGLAAALGLPAASAQPARSSGANAATIKLPAIEMLTGAVSYYGQLFMNGIQLGVTQINAKGGVVVHGRRYRIKLIKEDNASDNAQTVNLLRKYCSDRGVGILIAPTYNPNSDVGGPVSNQCGLPTVTGQGTTPTKAVNPRGFLFKNITIENDQIDATLAFAIKKVHAKRVAMITDTTDGALTGYRDENKRFLSTSGKALGASLVADVSTQANAGDYAPQISALQAAHPDLVLVQLVTADAARFMEEARGRGLTSPFAATWGALNDPTIYSLSHGAANGLIASAATPPPSAAAKDPPLARFLKAYKARFHKVSDPLALYTYDSTYLVAAALHRAGTTTDRNKIRAALAGMKTFCGVLCYKNVGHGVFKTSVVYFTHLTARGHVLDGKGVLK